MPIYEYRCESCGQELEKLQKISDPPLTDCPSCGKSALKKLVSASSFRLKGTGWYETDFKDKKKSKVGTGGSGDNDGAGNESGKESGKEKSTDSATAKSGSDNGDKSSTKKSKNESAGKTD